MKKEEPGELPSDEGTGIPVAEVKSFLEYLRFEKNYSINTISVRKAAQA